MKVFKISVDIDRFRFLQPQDGGLLLARWYRLDGVPKPDWPSPTMICPQPQLKRADFLGIFLTGAGFVTRPETTELLRPLLEQAGELLPLRYEAETYHVLNVTQCTDCLDEERSEWAIGETTGVRLWVTRYAFLANRLPSSSIFKIPQSWPDVLCYEGVKSNPDDEFKPFVEKHKLTGISFVEVWSSG